MANKTTKRENFMAIVEILKANGSDELVKVMENELDIMARKSEKAKNSVSKATVEKRAENGRLADIVLATLVENGDYMSIAEIKANSTELEDFSSSKLGYLLGTLIAEGKVDRIIKKRVASYKAIV